MCKAYELFVTEITPISCKQETNVRYLLCLQPSASQTVSGDPVLSILMLSTQCQVLLEKETPCFHPQLI